MGVFRIPIEVGDWEETKFETIDALADTGATYTYMPASLLTRLGVRRSHSMSFELADGSSIVRDFGWTFVRLNGSSAPTIVIFADDGATPLLGAFTLEGFGLGVDPVHARLIPISGHL